MGVLEFLKVKGHIIDILTYSRYSVSIMLLTSEGRFLFFITFHVITGETK